MKKLAVLLAAVACAEPATSTLAPRLQVGQSHAPVVIVQVEGNPAAVAAAHGIATEHVYTHTINGFAAQVSDLKGLMRDRRVKRVDNNNVISLATVQTNPRQGLDWVDQRTTTLDNQYIYDRTGTGVNAWIIDTGLRSTHVEFTGRIGTLIDFSGSGTTNDCHGHGTHVTGILGGTVYGVAKGVTLNVAKVIDCADTTTDAIVIAAIDSITAIATLPAVVNISLQGPVSLPVNAAITSSIATGLVYAVAAGNFNADACNYSPASAANALTVANAIISGTGVAKRSSDSNFGNCVDIFAPGLGVLSAWNTGDSATASLSGTSMSSPHVAGAAAMYLEGRPTASPAEVSDSLKAYSTRSVITASLSVNCNLLFTGRTIQGGHIGRCPK